MTRRARMNPGDEDRDEARASAGRAPVLRVAGSAGDPHALACEKVTVDRVTRDGYWVVSGRESKTGRMWQWYPRTSGDKERDLAVTCDEGLVVRLDTNADFRGYRVDLFGRLSEHHEPEMVVSLDGAQLTVWHGYDVDLANRFEIVTAASLGPSANPGDEDRDEARASSRSGPPIMLKFDALDRVPEAKVVVPCWSFALTPPGSSGRFGVVFADVDGSGKSMPVAKCDDGRFEVFRDGGRSAVAVGPYLSIATSGAPLELTSALWVEPQYAPWLHVEYRERVVEVGIFIVSPMASSDWVNADDGEERRSRQVGVWRSGRMTAGVIHGTSWAHSPNPGDEDRDEARASAQLVPQAPLLLEFEGQHMRRKVTVPCWGFMLTPPGTGAEAGMILVDRAGGGNYEALAVWREPRHDRSLKFVAGAAEVAGADALASYDSVRAVTTRLGAGIELWSDLWGNPRRVPWVAVGRHAGGQVVLNARNTYVSSDWVMDAAGFGQDVWRSGDLTTLGAIRGLPDSRTLPNPGDEDRDEARASASQSGSQGKRSFGLFDASAGTTRDVHKVTCENDAAVSVDGWYIDLHVDGLVLVPSSGDELVVRIDGEEAFASQGLALVRNGAGASVGVLVSSSEPEDTRGLNARIDVFGCATWQGEHAVAAGALPAMFPRDWREARALTVTSRRVGTRNPGDEDRDEARASSTPDRGMYVRVDDVSDGPFDKVIVALGGGRTEQGRAEWRLTCIGEPGKVRVFGLCPSDRAYVTCSDGVRLKGLGDFRLWPEARLHLDAWGMNVSAGDLLSRQAISMFSIVTGDSSANPGDEDRDEARASSSAEPQLPFDPFNLVEHDLIYGLVNVDVHEVAATSYRNGVLFVDGKPYDSRGAQSMRPRPGYELVVRIDGQLAFSSPSLMLIKRLGDDTALVSSNAIEDRRDFNAKIGSTGAEVWQGDRGRADHHQPTLARRALRGARVLTVTSRPLVVRNPGDEDRDEARASSGGTKPVLRVDGSHYPWLIVSSGWSEEDRNRRAWSVMGALGEKQGTSNWDLSAEDTVVSSDSGVTVRFDQWVGGARVWFSGREVTLRSRRGPDVPPYSSAPPRADLEVLVDGKRVALGSSQEFHGLFDGSGSGQPAFKPAFVVYPTAAAASFDAAAASFDAAAASFEAQRNPGDEDRDEARSSAVGSGTVVEIPRAWLKKEARSVMLGISSAGGVDVLAKHYTVFTTKGSVRAALVSGDGNVDDFIQIQIHVRSNSRDAVWIGEWSIDAVREGATVNLWSRGDGFKVVTLHLVDA